MTDFIFDTPYWILGLLVVLGISLFVSGNNRQEKRLMQAGFIPVALAFLLFISSTIFQTDKEKVIQRMEQLVQTVEKKDAGTAAGLLHPSANLHGFMNKKELLEAIGQASDEYRLKSLRVTSIEAAESRDAITVVVSVAADIDSKSWGGTTPSTWQIVWINTSSGYLARDITALKLPGIDIQSIIARWRK